jgi:nicotinamide-nucleotide amidase
MMVTAIVFSIGDELVLGQTIDTNSAWISRELAAIGVRVAEHVTVADDQAAIEKAIAELAARCQVLLVSGGLGPTEDDLTRQALAAVLGQPLEENPQAMAALIARFQKFGRPMSPSNRIQAMLPRGTLMIDNTAGTACGMSALLRSNDSEHSCQIFVMPGVPGEMKAMMTKSILPELRSLAGGAVIRSRTLHTFGLGESVIGEMLGDLMQRGRNPSVGTTVADGVVSLRINAAFPSSMQADEELVKTAEACRQKLGHLVYGQDEQKLAQVVAKLLLESKFCRSVATAESCTGGLLAKMLTDVAGSSAYFQRGWVTYANEAKTQLLKVPAELIEKKGAVSVEVTEAMAIGALQASNSDAALSITGIAGPDGGTPEKPVGTVCFGLAFNPESPEVMTRLFRFPGDRAFIRDRSAKMALTLLRFHLMQIALPF